MAAEFASLARDPLAELHRRVLAAEAAGRDLLGEMAAELERRAVLLRVELADLRSGTGD